MQFYTPIGFRQKNPCTCGPDEWSNRNKVDFVPDHIFGLNIKLACCVHDYMYIYGKTEDDREFADRVFYDNMLALIADDDTGWLITKARNATAWTYYKAVQWFGGSNFWRDK